MRWRTPEWMEDQKSDWAMVVLFSPLWIPAGAALFAGLGLLWVKRKAIGPREYWSKWFAWYPVRESAWTDWMWLEIVERRSEGAFEDTEFKGLPRP